MTQTPETGYVDLLRLDGRGVVVLGAGEGIGGAVCAAVTQAGGKVLCVDLDEAQAKRTAERVGGTAMAADVTDREALTEVFDRAEEIFGDGFHGVVDVVGVSVPEFLADATDESMKRQFDLVLRHPVLLTQIAHPRLARRGRGSVVFIGSLAGAANTRRLGLYGTAKAAVHHLATAAAMEFGPQGVRTNAIVTGRILRSGGTPTPQGEVLQAVKRAIPLGRAGVPEDIAGAVLFLLSDLAGYVNGARLPVDGGIGIVTPLPSSLPGNQPTP
jgi:NAD(P)-dependent dehydrogenase (short-subunit alcohol dehydrogenase family)